MPPSAIPLSKSPARMQAASANARPKRPFRDQLQDSVRLKFGGGSGGETLGGGSWMFWGTQLEDCQLQDGPQ